MSLSRHLLPRTSGGRPGLCIHTNSGPRLFDLCEIQEIAPVSGDTARSVLTLNPIIEGASFRFVIVEESLKEICAVLVGCMDATH